MIHLQKSCQNVTTVAGPKVIMTAADCGFIAQTIHRNNRLF